MAAQKQNTEDINLLPQKGFESSSVGRILAWVLSSFRIIVIITELIVMAAFLSRFWLDAQNSDLTEEIEQKQAVLAASASFENEFKKTQTKIAAYKQLSSSPKLSEITKQVASATPEEIFLSSINLLDDRVIVSGYSPSELPIQQFSVNLNSFENMQGASISLISTSEKTADTMKFEVVIPLNKKEEQK